jgi:hypothetical protein
VEANSFGAYYFATNLFIMKDLASVKEAIDAGAEKYSENSI